MNDIKNLEDYELFSYEIDLDCIMVKFMGFVFVCRFDPYELLVNGDKIDPTKGISPLKKEMIKEINKVKYPKKTIWRGEQNGFVCKLDAGLDGRLFWKIYSKKAQVRLNGQPYKIFSIFPKPKQGIFEVYSGDLKRPGAIVRKKWEISKS